jgi:lipopolysaccharide export system protein LptC
VRPRRYREQNVRDKLTLLIAIVLLASVTATSYWYARSLRLPAGITLVRSGTPDFEADKIVITQFDTEGRAKNKLFAERMLHFGETDDVELLRPRLLSLRPDQPQVEVRADRGRVENAGEKVHLHGNVAITRAAHAAVPALRVDTSYLLALPDLDRYSTDQPVAVQRGGARISAQQGMQIDNVARTAQFMGSVKMSLPPR